MPPAWTEVWICPKATGHIQATGRDAKGRKQYRYHARFREVRESTKYHRMLAFADSLPAIRAKVHEHLALPGLQREKVLATVVHLLEATLIRVGSDEYARTNKSYGLTTLKNRHVDVEGSQLKFNFKGKSGGTVLAAMALSEFQKFDSAAGAKRNIRDAIQKVAARLGNTPTICRKCYIHTETITTYVEGSLLLEVKDKVEAELRDDISALKSEEVAVLTRIFVETRLAFGDSRHAALVDRPECVEIFILSHIIGGERVLQHTGRHRLGNRLAPAVARITVRRGWQF